MTIAIRRYQTATVDNANIETTAQAKTTPAYNRVLVFLGNTSATGSAIATAREIMNDNAEIVLICRSHNDADATLKGWCRSLCQQGVSAHGYIVNSNMKAPPAWLVESEQADAVVVAQSDKKGLWGWPGNDTASEITRRTGADVYTVII